MAGALESEQDLVPTRLAGGSNRRARGIDGAWSALPARDTGPVEEGEPSSYLVLARAPPVYGSDGQTVGKVKKVLCEPGADIFDGFELLTPRHSIAAE